MTIQQLLQYTLENKASDLHLVVGSSPLIRVDGTLIAVVGEPLLESVALENLIWAVVTPDQKQLFLVNKELDFSFVLGTAARFRVNVYFQKGTLAGSFRLIPLSVPTLEELGMPKILSEIAKLKQGFVLVT